MKGGLREREGTLRSETERCWHVRLEMEPRDSHTSSECDREVRERERAKERKKERIPVCT